MKIALAQLNYLIGDFEGNLSKIVNAVQRAVEQGSDLIVFSETDQGPDRNEQDHHQSQ